MSVISVVLLVYQYLSYENKNKFKDLKEILRFDGVFTNNKFYLNNLTRSFIYLINPIVLSYHTLKTLKLNKVLLQVKDQM